MRSEADEVGQLSEERRQWIEDFQHARDSTDEVLASCVECYGDADSPHGHAPGCRVPRLIAKDRLR